jgi:hypothetical protein
MKNSLSLREFAAKQNRYGAGVATTFDCGVFVETKGSLPI